MNDPKYPIGPFEPREGPLTDDERAELVGRIRALPTALKVAVEGLSEPQLDTPYREGGWSPRQIAHHLADSHLNAFIRLKLAATEERPTILPYDQDRWARTADVLDVPVGASLAVLTGLHDRWARLLDSLAPGDFGRNLVHPEIGEIDIEYLLQLYAWHGRHHVTQIAEQRKREGW
jgi:hypothetical protein